MERKYTPGPWQVVNGSDVFTGLGARNAAGVEAAENDGWHIADCDMGPSSTGEGEADIPHAEKLANARLIAAAPDLVEALAAVRRYLAQCPPHAGDTTGTEHGRMMDAAGAALLKAGHDL